MWQKELHKVIKWAGSQHKLAVALGLNRKVINNWLNRDVQVPVKYALQIEILMKGRVLAERLAPYAKTEILNFKKYLSEKMLNEKLYGPL